MESKKERDQFEDGTWATELSELEEKAEYRYLLPSDPKIPRNPNITRVTYWVTGTTPEYLEFNALVIELYVACGMSKQAIADMFGCALTTIVRCLRKYHPKQGEHDITMTIKSKL